MSMQVSAVNGSVAATRCWTLFSSTAEYQE